MSHIRVRIVADHELEEKVIKEREKNFRFYDFVFLEFEWWVGERHGSLIRPLFQQIIAEQVEIIVS